MKTELRIVGAAILLLLYGCEPSPDSSADVLGMAPSPDHETALADGEPANELISRIPPSISVDARPAALINGAMLSWGDMRPALNEAAGAAVLEEYVLDRMVIEALQRAGLVITQNEVEIERRLFYDSLSADPNVAVRLANELRWRQGMGPNRFERLLKRNASMRALVKDDVQVTGESIRRMYWIVHGPKRQARIIVVSTLSEAQDATRRIQGGEAFADVAVRISTDSSAARGGLLEPLNQQDPAYPQALRDALWDLQVGEVSSPILLDNGYALLQLESELPASDASLAEEQIRLERMVQLNQERLLMDQLARQMLFQAAVKIFDESLRDSWRRRMRTGG